MIRGGVLPEVEVKSQVHVVRAGPAPMICTVGLVASHQITAISFQSEQKCQRVGGWGGGSHDDVMLNFSWF